MKQCPRCYRKYSDETIAFCLDDGTPLLASTAQEATLTIPAPRVTEPMPQMSAPIPSAPPQIIKQGVSPYYAYVLIALIAILIGGGAVALLYQSKKDSSSAAPKSAETPTASPSNTPVKTQTTDQTANEKTESRTSSSVPGKYPEGSTRLLTQSDLAEKSRWELRVMRNEIYARHGYIFKNTELRNYFEQQPWYKPQSDDVTNLLSNIEKENATFLKNYE